MSSHKHQSAKLLHSNEKVRIILTLSLSYSFTSSILIICVICCNNNIQDITNTGLAQHHQFEDGSFKIIKPEVETRKNSVVFNPVLVEKHEQLSVEDGGTESENEDAKKGQIYSGSFYPSSGRSSIFSRVSAISFCSNTSARHFISVHYSCVMTLCILIIFFLGFFLGAWFF